MVEAISVIQTVAILWLGYLVYALKDAVKAQHATIRAQAEQLKTMKTVLDSTDEPKMLERLKAYKEFVDREKEGALRQQAAEFEEEKKQMSVAQRDFINWSSATQSSLLGLVATLMPYVPPEQRVKTINASNVPDDFKQLCYRMAAEAPDLSVRENRPSLAGLLQALTGLPPPLPALDITERRLSEVLPPPPPPRSAQTPTKKP